MDTTKPENGKITVSCQTLDVPLTETQKANKHTLMTVTLSRSGIVGVHIGHHRPLFKIFSQTRCLVHEEVVENGTSAEDPSIKPRLPFSQEPSLMSKSRQSDDLLLANRNESGNLL